MPNETLGIERESLMLKGVLDLCVLAILSNKPTHAYGLVEALRARDFDQTSYGTIYPLVPSDRVGHPGPGRSRLR